VGEGGVRLAIGDKGGVAEFVDLCCVGTRLLTQGQKSTRIGEQRRQLVEVVTNLPATILMKGEGSILVATHCPHR
jgi:hypothetical protein